MDVNTTVRTVYLNSEYNDGYWWQKFQLQDLCEEREHQVSLDIHKIKVFPAGV